MASICVGRIDSNRTRQKTGSKKIITARYVSQSQKNLGFYGVRCKTVERYNSRLPGFVLNAGP